MIGTQCQSNYASAVSAVAESRHYVRDVITPMIAVADALARNGTELPGGGVEWSGSFTDLAEQSGLAWPTVKEALQDIARLRMVSREGKTITGTVPEGYRSESATDDDSPDRVEEWLAQREEETDTEAAEAASVAVESPAREVDYRMAVMDALGLSIGARYTGVAIARHCWRSGEMFAGMDVVSEWIGNSPESRKTTGKYVRELVAAGYLVPVGNVGRTTRYRLTLPA